MNASSIATILATLSLGAVAGMTGTLLGLGGGVFLVPFLVLILGLPFQQAAAISLVTVIATSSAVSAARAGRHLINLRFGMLPLDSTLTFDGPMPDRPPRPGVGLRAIDPVSDADLLARLDRSSVGFARPADHDFWLGVPGLMGRIIDVQGVGGGYLYVSEGGAIGPIAFSGKDFPKALERQGPAGCEQRCFDYMLDLSFIHCIARPCRLLEYALR